MKKYDALIFDLDGTLWDATNGITYAWNQIFQQNNISLQLSLSDIQNVMGYTVKEIAQKIEYIHLANKEEFASCYIRHIDF